MKNSRNHILFLLKQAESFAKSLLNTLKANIASRIVFVVGLLFLPLLLLLTVYFSGAYSFDPMTGLYEKVRADSSFVKVNDSLRQIVLSEQHLKSTLQYRQNELKLAGQDSVYLLMNFADSILSLGIKGVEVHAVSVSELEISNNFQRILQQVRQQWIGTVFVLDSSVATIAKEPIVVKQAPENNNDSLPAATPIVHDTLPVLYTLYFHPSLMVQVEQNESINDAHDELLSTYKARVRLPKTTNPVFNMFINQRHKEAVMIKLHLPEADARAIYRAIPKHANALLSL